MSENQNYPFERNRYYPGKMLTSADFQAEQNYNGGKRQFLNRLLYGAGIVCGCGVFSLDDLSVLIESGVILDGYGREIVVDSSVVRKLSAVEGYDGLESELAALCIEYKEEEVHAVYAVNRQADRKEYEYNRISEGYRIFLQDANKIPAGISLKEEFFQHRTIVETDDFLVELIMPATVCNGRNVKFVLRCVRKTEENKKLYFSGRIQVPAFFSEEGTHELKMEIESATAQEKKVTEKEYWLGVEENTLSETDVIIKGESCEMRVDGEKAASPGSLSFRIRIENCTPAQLVNREIGKNSLEMQSVEQGMDYVPLAYLKLVRTDSAYVIEEVLENKVKKYIPLPSGEEEREEYLSYFLKQPKIEEKYTKTVSVSEDGKVTRELSRVNDIATGVLEIPLGENTKQGDIFYSGEIIHGLGNGNVYVQIGYENVEEDANLGINARNTIYGNSALFSGSQKLPMDVETAVKVLNDKGSFVVAARLTKKVDFLLLSYRWVAVKFPSGADMGVQEDYSGKSISAETPTVVLGTRESYYFNIKYNNMPASSVTYELTEAGSGEITSEGVYTAPAKEGVYEIRIYCTDMPVICTYAYAIVKKKVVESEEG